MERWAGKIAVVTGASAGIGAAIARSLVREGFSAYPASKRAVTGLAQSLRHELAGTRIRITSISPGLVATEFMASYSMFSEEAMMAMPTLNPNDVAAAAIYVLSNPSHVLVQDVVLRPLGESW